MKHIKKPLLFRSLAMVLLIASLTCPPAFAIPPEIHSVEPDHGPINSPTNITIYGDNFESIPKVALYGGGPYIVGSVDPPVDAKDVHVSGNYAYVADGAGLQVLQVIDISDPTNPIIVSSVDTPGWAKCVYVSGNYAYVVDGAGLQVIDISNPLNPTIVGSVDTPGIAGCVYVLGDYAYVTHGGAVNGDYDNDLQVIDISDPTNPIIVGSVDTPGLSGCVHVSGNYAYVADGDSGLQVIDISDPTNPIIVGSVDTPGLSGCVHVSGNYAYVADGDSGLQVIDISNPTNPIIVGSVDTPGGCVHVSGNYAYVAGDAGLQVIDISDPTNPIIVGSVDTEGWAVGVYVSGNYAYVADRYSGLQVIDISDLANPTIVGSVDTPGSAEDVHVAGSYAYVADGASGLQVIDMSDPTNPIIVGSVDTPGLSGCVHVSGNYAYVADGDSGLQVIDISDPTNPIIVGSVDTPGGCVHVSGNYAYVAGGDLQVIDISDPTNPIIVGSESMPLCYEGPCWARGIHVAGNYAYVLWERCGFEWCEGGMAIIDITDPTNPIIVGSVDTEGWAVGVYVSGNYAYVADRYSGLQVIDISDLANPTIVSSIDTPGSARGVYVLDNYAYVAGDYSGLQVLRAFEPCTNIAFVDSTTLTATVPPGLPKGTYNLHVVNPNGERAILHNSFTVLEVAKLLYTPVSPCRIVDTRKTSVGIIGASTQRNFRVFGDSSTISAQGGNSTGCPAPSGKPLAAHINMVAVNPTGKGNMKAFPVGGAPGANLGVNFANIGTNFANAGTVETSTGSGSDITVASNYSSAHAAITVLGYYYPDGDLSYTPVTPCKIVDTRNTSAGMIGASTQRNFHVFGDSSTISAQGGNSTGCPAPSGKPLAAHINMVAVNPTGKGNMKAFPVGGAPGANLGVNFANIGTNFANAGTVETSTGSGSDITVASNYSSAHAAITVLGYYYPDGDLSYTPVTPCKIVDTRNTSAGMIGASTQRNFHVFGDSSTISAQGGNSTGCPAPSGEPLAAHINMVAVNPIGKGNMKVFPVGGAPGVNLGLNFSNIGTNLANAGTVKTITGSGPDITVASNYSSAHVTIQVLGYYYQAP